jgi:hypothetical protein
MISNVGFLIQPSSYARPLQIAGAVAAVLLLVFPEISKLFTTRE